MSNILTYDPASVHVIINGYECTALEFVAVRRQIPAFFTVKGINGINTRVRNLDTSATIELVVKQTSITNDVLSYIHEEDARWGTAGFSITIKDKGGTSYFVSDDASIPVLPPLRFHTNLSPREWHIVCGSSSVFHVGGNFTPSVSLF